MINEQIHFERFTKKHLIRMCKKQHKNCSRLIRQKIELKKQLDFMERACDGAAEMYDDLKTAKELLKLFVQWHYGCCKEPYYKNLVKQAEQFLKEHE